MASRKAIVGSTHCIKLHHAWGNEADLWVDPNRDDVIVAWEPLWIRNYELFVTIDYRRDPKYGWIPTGWTQTSPRKSGIPRIEHTVTSLAINQDIAEPTFTLEFPAGANVLDRMILERYTVGNDHTKTIVEKWDSTASLRVAETLELLRGFDIDHKQMKDVLESISRENDFKVVIDPAVMRAGVDPAMPVNLKSRGNLKEALTAVLKQAPKPLVYELHNGVMTIVPAPGAK